MAMGQGERENKEINYDPLQALIRFLDVSLQATCTLIYGAYEVAKPMLSSPFCC
jgi:hypothetical protein